MPRHLSAAKIMHFHDITKFLPNYFIHTPLRVIFPLRFLATAINTIRENSCVKRQDQDGILPLCRYSAPAVVSFGHVQEKRGIEGVSKYNM